MKQPTPKMSDEKTKEQSDPAGSLYAVEDVEPSLKQEVCRSGSSQATYSNNPRDLWLT